MPSMFRTAPSTFAKPSVSVGCHVVADGDAGDKLEDALEGHGNWASEIIEGSDTAKGLVLLPRRWVVERTSEWVTIARIRMLTRRTVILSTH